MRSFQTPLRLAAEDASLRQKTSFSDRQKLRKQNALRLEAPAQDSGEGKGPMGAFRAHSFTDSDNKESFSDRQKQRKAGELTIPDDVKPILATRAKSKVSFSESQRQRKLRQRAAVASIDSIDEYGSSWLIHSSDSSPAGTPHAFDDKQPAFQFQGEREGSSPQQAGVTGDLPVAVVVPAAASRKLLHVKLGPSAKRLVSGAIAGAVSRTLVAPLETIRTHLMVGNTGKKTAGEVYRWIMETEGWKGLFRGNSLNVLRIAPAKAIELFTYDTVKRVLTPKDGTPPRIPLPLSSVAGSSAGIASCALTYPLELVKTRLTVQPKDYHGVFHAFWKIISQEGVGELYRGLTPSIIGVIPYAGTNYFAYDTLRTLYKKVTGKREIEPLATLLIGSMAGAFAASATFPLEVARKQMQVGALKGRVVYKGTLDCMRCIIKDQGVGGLYKGLGPSCMKLMPAAGISFMCYEILKKILIEEQ